MRRRDVLKLAAALPVMATAKVYAAPEAGSRLLVVFMRGAYDAASLLVPTASDFYYESRPTIAIPRPGSGENAALALAGDWALHPALADSLMPLWQKKQLAFIPFAGTEDNTRSHFETQNRVELGQPDGGAAYGSGFLNRLAAQFDEGRIHPGAFTQQVPVILRGEVDVPNVALANQGVVLGPRQRGLIESMYADTELEGAIEEGFAVQDEASAALEKEMQEADGGAVSPGSLEAQMGRVASLMRERFNLGFVDVGGWDTHVTQGGATGALADRLGSFGTALARFADGMGPEWRNTVVVVISEFGRTLRENGNRGTDHGHGTVYWVLGGGIDGGRIVGDEVAVTRDKLFEDRDYPVLNEYRGVFAGLFQRLYGLDDARLQQVFGEVRPRDLGLV